MPDWIPDRRAFPPPSSFDPTTIQERNSHLKHLVCRPIKDDARHIAGESFLLFRHPLSFSKEKSLSPAPWPTELKRRNAGTVSF